MEGKVVLHDHANRLAAITFDLPPGFHRVEVSLEDTRIRTFSNYLSLAAWAIFLTVGAGLGFRAAWRAYCKSGTGP